MSAPVDASGTAEPMPGSAVAPFIPVAAQRVWDRLPQVYRTMDVGNAWQFKRLLGALFTGLQDIDALVARLAGSRPVGPLEPAPWDLSDEDLARWIEARRDVNSALTDPDLADASWLPWLAQMLGSTLDPTSGEQERRDTLRFATSGFNGGTQGALADAARSVLTGSRYVQVQPGLKADGTVGTMWDITLRTRSSETPDPDAIIPTILRKGAKPAGVRLWVSSFGTSWDRLEALVPTWSDWEQFTWSQLEEIAATYAVPENLAPGPSFESAADIAKWTPVAEGGGSAPTWALQSGGGVDGVNAGRLTKVGATGGMRLRSQVITDARVLQNRDYVDAVSLRPSTALPATLTINWQTSAGAAISSTSVVLGTLTAGEWNRQAATTKHTSPANAARAVLDVVFTGTVPAGAYVDVDAALFRLITAAGG